MRLAAVLVAGLALAAAGTATGTRSERPRNPAALPVRGALLRADVDGDGVIDRAVVRCKPGPDAFLVLSTRHRTLVRRIATRGCGVSVALTVLAPIDRVRGAEMVVTEGAGSAYFAGVYTVRRGRIVRMTIGSEGFWHDSFAYYGGAAHDAAVDCIGRASGRIVASSWSWDDARDTGLISYTYLRIVGTAFRRVRATQVFSRENRRPWYGRQQPFPSCAVARAPS